MQLSSSLVIWLLLAASVVFGAVAWFAYRARQVGVTPLVAASHVLLRQGWYQINLRVINRAAYALGGVSLRCLKPRRARLLAPISSVSLKEGDFQIWADPETDKPVRTIALDFVIGPHGTAPGAETFAAEAHPTAWLFLTGKKPAGDVLLELTLRDGQGRLYRYELTSKPQAASA